MKTMVSVLGTILLAGAVALAQSSNGNASSKSSTNKNSTASSADSSNSGSTSTGAQAGNSGFDSSDSAQTPAANSSASSGQSGTSSSSAPATSAASTQYGSSRAQSISNGPVAETVSDSSALIGWSTHDASSNTGLKYGANRGNLTETAQGTDGTDGKNHHARLQGLSPSTRYYFQVTENGEPVGGVGTFKTTASGEAPVQSKAVIPQK